MVVNAHEREYPAPSTEVAALVATLSSKDDRLWPHERWPRMRLDPGLTPGGSGGHGPIRYLVESVDPARRVVFRFTGPPGFDGWHAFDVIKLKENATLLRHEIRMHPRGWAKLTWPLFFRPLHDALLEEALDKAARELGANPSTRHRLGVWARLLYPLATKIGSPKRKGADRALILRIPTHTHVKARASRR